MTKPTSATPTQPKDGEEKPSKVDSKIEKDTKDTNGEASESDLDKVSGGFHLA